MEIKLLIDSDLYLNEQDKMNYAWLRLIGTAANTMRPYFSKSLWSFTSYEGFLTKLTQSYGQHHDKEAAMTKLQTLRQANKSFNAYATDFRRLIQEAGHEIPLPEESADSLELQILNMFRTGLSQEMAQGLIHAPKHTKLESFIALCYETENNIKLAESSTQRANSRNINTTYLPSSFTTIVPAPAMLNNTPPTAVPEPMDLSVITVNGKNFAEPNTTHPNLGSKPIRSWTHEEKKMNNDYRRQNNLCVYCGKTGHIVRDCITKNKPNSNNRRLFPSQMNTFQVAQMSTTPSSPTVSPYAPSFTSDSSSRLPSLHSSSAYTPTSETSHTNQEN